MQPIAAPLLQWFQANKRLLPFRQEPSAYHIWVSEIMLQQTRVAAAIPYYNRFIAALPTPADLAVCEPDALRKLWQGLGYYNRVNNMQKAARIVCEQYGGDLPADYDALRSLPGIGDYTAGAIASIAFGIPAPAVDGNVLRVFARLYNDDADVMAPATRRLFTRRVLDQMPKAAPGPYNEALMELGALVCIPGTPHCEACPLADRCLGCAAGRAGELPVKPAPKAKTTVPVTVALVESDAGLLLQRRPAKGLLAGLWQPAAWEKALTKDELTAALAKLGVQADVDRTTAAREACVHPPGVAAFRLARTSRCLRTARRFRLGRPRTIGRGIPRAQRVWGICKTVIKQEGSLNCTPFVRQYGILSNKWGVFLCQKEYQTNDIRRNSKNW